MFKLRDYSTPLFVVGMAILIVIAVVASIIEHRNDSNHIKQYECVFTGQVITDTIVSGSSTSSYNSHTYIYKCKDGKFFKSEVSPFDNN